MRARAAIKRIIKLDAVFETIFDTQKFTSKINLFG